MNTQEKEKNLKVVRVPKALWKYLRREAFERELTIGETLVELLDFKEEDK